MFDLLLFRSVFIIELSIVYITHRDLYMYRAMVSINRKNDIMSASEWRGMCENHKTYHRGVIKSHHVCHPSSAVELHV